jgi:hypothetical protein
VPPYHDIYVLARERSAAEAEQFLEAFAPNRVQSAAEYTFPERAGKPGPVFTAALEAIRYAALCPGAEQRFYFRNLDEGPDHIMLFFTSDGGLILGLSVAWNEERAFAQLKRHAGSEIGYITFECPPKDTAAEFIRRAEAHLRDFHSRGASDEYA